MLQMYESIRKEDERINTSQKWGFFLNSTDLGNFLR